MGVLSGIARRRIQQELMKPAPGIIAEEADRAENAYQAWKKQYPSSGIWSTGSDVLEQVVKPWHYCFASSVALPSTGRRYGCGFSINVDRVCGLNPYTFAVACEDGSRTAGGWENLGKRIAEVLKEPEPISKIQSQQDVLAALIYDIVYGKGGKPKVNDKWLLDWIKDIFGPSHAVVGGAGGFLAN